MEVTIWVVDQGLDSGDDFPSPGRGVVVDIRVATFQTEGCFNGPFQRREIISSRRCARSLCPTAA